MGGFFQKPHKKIKIYYINWERRTPVQLHVLVRRDSLNGCVTQDFLGINPCFNGVKKLLSRISLSMNLHASDVK